MRENSEDSHLRIKSKQQNKTFVWSQGYKYAIEHLFGLLANFPVSEQVKYS